MPAKLVDLCASLRQTELRILDADQGEKTDVAIAIAVREPKAVVREADVVGIKFNIQRCASAWPIYRQNRGSAPAWIGP